MNPTIPDTTTTRNGVSCQSDSTFAAVGSSGGSSINQTFAEVLSDGTWTITPTPDPTGNLQNDLQSVSCSSAMSCMAVGNSLASGRQTLTEAWDGSTWSIVPSPNSVGSTNTQLNGVSSARPSDCTAAGSHETGNNYSLIEAWNGVSWSIVPSPSPVADSLLFGVSCPDTSDCTAVGSTDTETGEPDVFALIMSGTAGPPANAPEVPAPLLLPFSVWRSEASATGSTEGAVADGAASCPDSFQAAGGAPSRRTGACGRWQNAAQRWPSRSNTRLSPIKGTWP